MIRNGLIRNKLALRNRFRDQFANLLPKDKEHLALRNNFRVTKKFLNHGDAYNAFSGRCWHINAFVFIIVQLL